MHFARGAYLIDFESRIDPDENPPPISRVKGSKPKGNEPDFNLRSHLHRVFETDLTQVDGINVLTAQALFAEIGSNLSKFPSVNHFCYWLGLCPNNKVSGGRILARTLDQVQIVQRKLSGLPLMPSGKANPIWGIIIGA